MKNSGPSNFRVENVAPILYVKDMAQSLSFYVGILGFKNADWGDDNFTSINRDNTGLYLCNCAKRTDFNLGKGICGAKELRNK